VISDKQKQLFQALKNIKDGNVGVSLSKLQKGIDQIDLAQQQNEIIETVIYEILELIDGYNADIGFSLDLIKKGTGQSLKGNTELHDKFMDYLSEVENE